MAWNANWWSDLEFRLQSAARDQPET